MLQSESTACRSEDPDIFDASVPGLEAEVASLGPLTSTRIRTSSEEKSRSSMTELLSRRPVGGMRHIHAFEDGGMRHIHAFEDGGMRHIHAFEDGRMRQMTLRRPDSCARRQRSARRGQPSSKRMQTRHLRLALPWSNAQYARYVEVHRFLRKIGASLTGKRSLLSMRSGMMDELKSFLERADADEDLRAR